MCLTTSSTSKSDIFWLGEAILVYPDGLQRGKRDVLLEVNGLVRPNLGKDEGKLTFMHRGEIYDLEERSTDWLSENDWYVKHVFRNSVLPWKSISPIPLATNKVTIRCRQEIPPFDARMVEAGEHQITDVAVFGPQRLYPDESVPLPRKSFCKEAIFSRFSIRFKAGDMQLFRVRFRTSFGFADDYDNQLDMTVEGPAIASEKVRQDILNRVPAGDYRDSLCREIDGIAASLLLPPYDLAIIPHPAIAASVEATRHAEMHVTAPVETKDTPIRSAACPARSIFFDMRERDFVVRIVGPITPRRIQYSEQFSNALDELGFGTAEQ